MSHKCELCQSENQRIIYQSNRDGIHINNVICNDCGFIFVLPRPLMAIKAQSNNVALEEKKIKKAEAVAFKRFKLLESVIGAEAFTNDAKSALEIGCGTGSFLRYISAAGWDVKGIESDAVFARTGRERYGLPIENLHVEEFNHSHKFNLISSFHGIDNVENVNEFLIKINDLLNYNGVLFIESRTIDKMYGPNIDSFFGHDDVNTFSNLTLQSFLVKHGFEIIKQTIFDDSLSCVCRKTNKQHNYQQYFDKPARIFELLKVRQNSESFTLSKLINKTNVKLKRTAKALIGTFSKAEGKSKDKLNIAHIGFHNAGNTGDVVLFESVRLLFSNIKKDIQFSLFNVHDKVTPELIKTLNTFDLIIIGGGGLFLKDTNPNDISGWQWACPNELMEQITTPIAVFAVGYNRFRGQEDFHENFKRSLAILIDKSISFGIRNTGSINKLKDYLDLGRQKQIIYQACSTTFLDKYFKSPDHINESKKIGVNIAFDRHHLRFQGKEKQILYDVAEALKHFTNEGWQIDIISHVPTDQEAQVWFKARGLNLNIVNIENQHIDKVAEIYKQYKMVLGMRGHAQMIPFGLGVPIITLSTHDKMMYFLEDIDHTEWGIELIKEDNLKGAIIDKVNYINNNYPLIKKQIEDAQEKLWQASKNNIENIFSSLKN
jgi:polysaccharide pyruvyl transferase WcaK-like protein/2-polyprenyl-3-methyl-5-hydroxy-6-metoxy-1,4-benzoquinol methylase